MALLSTVPGDDLRNFRTGPLHSDSSSCLDELRVLVSIPMR
jgi:glycerate-2-kinase